MSTARRLLSMLTVLLLTRGAEAQQVVVVMTWPIAPYQEALDGVRDVLPGALDVENLNGDQGRAIAVCRLLQRRRPAVVVALGQLALTSATRELHDVPVVFSMVNNPQRFLPPGTPQVTGASLNIPMERMLEEVARIFPGRTRVGVVYDPANTGWLVDSAPRLTGLVLVTEAIHDAKEAPGAFDRLRDKVDLLLLLPDSTVLAEPVGDYPFRLSAETGVPVVGVSEKHARAGAVVALVLDSREVGRSTGRLVARVLAGEGAGRIPVTHPTQFRVIRNSGVARRLGLKLPSFLDEAPDVSERLRGAP